MGVSKFKNRTRLFQRTIYVKVLFGCLTGTVVFTTYFCGSWSHKCITVLCSQGLTGGFPSIQRPRRKPARIHLQNQHYSEGPHCLSGW